MEIMRLRYTPRSGFVFRRARTRFGWRRVLPFLLASALIAPARSAILISQYYEGTSNNKWIELYNTGDDAVNLADSSIYIGLWSNAARETWKTSAAPSASLGLQGFIPAGGVFTLANSSATLSIASQRSNVATTGTSAHVINFNGDDSIVVYQGSTYAFANVVDAFGVTSNSAADVSYSRKTSVTGGTNADFAAGDWDQFSNSDVNSATPSSDSYIGAFQRGGIAVTWDTNGITSGVGGSGTWDTTTLRFTSKQAGSSTSGEVYMWSNTTNSRDTVIFGGTAGNVSVSGTKTLGSMIFTTSGYSISGNTLTLDGTGNVEVIGSAVTATVNTAILTNTGVDLRKRGGGKLVLTGNNAYSGTTTVHGGTLTINGAHTGGGAFTVKTGATLEGIGSTGAPVFVESGGVISPGASVEDLGTGNLNMHGGAIFNAEVHFIELAPSVADQIDVSGTVTLGDGVSAFPQLTFVASYTGQPGNLHTFVLVDNDSGDLIATTDRFAGGTAVSSPPNATHAFDYILGLLHYRVHYNANSVNGFGDGNDIVIEFTSVPEPSMLSLAVGALLARRRNRRR